MQAAGQLLAAGAVAILEHLEWRIHLVGDLAAETTTFHDLILFLLLNVKIYRRQPCFATGKPACVAAKTSREESAHTFEWPALPPKRASALIRPLQFSGNIILPAAGRFRPRCGRSAPGGSSR